MFTLHSVNHVTGKEKIEDFKNYQDALLEFKRTRKALMNLYDSMEEYSANYKTIVYEPDGCWCIETDKMDIYLEQCEG